MTFGEALEKLKDDKKVVRHNWHAEYLWVALQRPDKDSKMKHAYLYVCPANEELVPWIPCQADLLAADWYEVK